MKRFAWRDLDLKKFCKVELCTGPLWAVSGGRCVPPLGALEHIGFAIHWHPCIPALRFGPVPTLPHRRVPTDRPLPCSPCRPIRIAKSAQDHMAASPTGKIFFQLVARPSMPAARPLYLRPLYSRSMMSALCLLYVHHSMSKICPYYACSVSALCHMLCPL